ncbi:hypothetical protein [Limosilactobacillus caviae]|uniref:hypothetical protein n=1 Tax=Limosilactobacillus caviae TaxID=1769424 RepID=UPI001E5D1DA7|nr:hypothetical protein [Limosilactobacillus caviae]MCD7124046.1 hypothetical protein [Limosilactobacillus caviae]MCD7124646.1 hypothetical protein [Limosilactobacillus caviae]MCD7124650.1 hypothetical protein [Limosilactobacillus caviae]
MQTPVKLIEAMDSLTENHEWGGATEMPEDVLAPDDWRLKAILNYRAETKRRDSSKAKQAEERIKRYFAINNISNPYAQAFILRKIGTAQIEILRITGLSKNDYYNHIGMLFRSKKNYGHLRVLDVEAMLRKANLKLLLEGRQWEK